MFRRMCPGLLITLSLLASPVAAQIAVYFDQATFLADASAAAATGPLPDLGLVMPPTAVGSITFDIGPGGDNLAIGGLGVAGLPAGDWYEPTPGNDIAMGFESLLVQTDAPVYALGFDLVEPDSSMPAWGGVPIDTTFEVILYSAGAEVARFEFNVDDDVQAFVGVWSSAPFDRATIIDITMDDDDEYFQDFYTGFTPLPIGCYADCDGSGALDFFDFLCFQNAFAGGDPYADCDGTGALDFFDFLCFQNEFAAGCP
jgi:hypothetical protein